ncbi:unnamed protein product [Cunninghamella blakesleeana]
MHCILSIGSTKATVKAAGIHTSATRLAISKFNLPAMSPTMTEGTIQERGEAFSAGDVLLELETDKAQIDVEAPEDGILAKIVLSEGQKAPVNTLIALLAEEGDDLSNLEIPKDEPTSSNQPQEEKKVETQVSSTPSQPLTPVTPMSHHDLDTSKLKKPLSPSVLGLIMRYHIKDIESIKASGPGGRILKGDVLGHLGLITPKPAPKPTYSLAPPRDQIEFAKKPADEKVEKSEKKEKVETLPNFIERQVSIDAVLDLQNGNQQINAILSKAAAKALEEVNGGKVYSGRSDGGIILDQQRTSYSGKYLGGAFKVFHLAEPNYDFISDSYVPSKPYTLKVNEIQQASPSKKQETMIDIIDYLGGNTPSYNRLNNKKTTNGYHVDIQLQGGTPGKIISDKKAKLFLDRLEYYIRHPNEIIV